MKLIKRDLLVCSLLIILATFCCLGGCAVKKQYPRAEYNSRNFQDLKIPGDNKEMTSAEYERLGDILLNDNKVYMAYLQYERALRLDPENTMLLYKKGLTFLVGDKNDDAIKEFQNVLKKKPDYALAYEGIGQAFFQMKDYEKGAENLQKAVALDRSLWKSHNFLGIIYNYQKKYKEAISEYHLAIELNPQEGFLYNNMGITYFLQGNYMKAAHTFEEALKTRQADKIYNNLGLALSYAGRNQAALEAFTKGGGEARAYNNLGFVYFVQGDKEKAVRCFEKAMEAAPTFYSAASENLKKVRRGQENKE